MKVWNRLCQERSTTWDWMCNIQKQISAHHACSESKFHVSNHELLLSIVESS